MISIVACGVSCRQDMQDQPRYKQQKKSDFFADGKAMRELPEGTVARGFLRENKAFYQGKKENVDTGAQATTAIDASGNTVVTSFPSAIEKNPVPITAELIDRGEERYKVFCMVCHGPVGNGDGMIVRRGYPKPPTYNDDRLRNAPDGHFYDVITNGWGKMNSYASMIPPEDRWAIVAYIRALQISQNPNGNAQMTGNQMQSPAIESSGNNAAVPQTESGGGRNR
ncbi:MAG TPA: cytochrome c [Pyrinomonadaceae bacterium]|nr:cytochrome c [Pyrinomonadaceae bacterium]